MSRYWSVGLIGWLIGMGLLGCATVALPPSESTMDLVRSYKNQLESRIASGHLTRAQAREMFYAKLEEIQPPLPNLQELLQLRKEVEAQVGTKVLTPQQAEARLAARESDMVTRWEEMAAQDARRQREIQRRQDEYQRGYQEEQQREQTIKALPRF